MLAAEYMIASEVDPNFLRILNRGLEDIEAGRTLPHREAMAEVRQIREERRQARSNMGVAANAGISYTFD